MEGYTHNQINPFIGCEQNTMIGRNGEYTIGYKMELPAIFTFDEETLDKLTEAFCKGIRNMPPYSRIHRQDFILERHIDLGQLRDKNYFTESYLKTFSNRPILCQESYIYFTLIPPAYHKVSILEGSFSKKKNFYKLKENAIREFQEKVAQFTSFLSSVKNQTEQGQPSYINFKILSPEEYLANISSQKEDGVLPKTLFLGNTEYGDICYDKQTAQLHVGENLVDIFTLSALNNLPPEVESVINYDTYDLPACWGAFISTLLPFPHIVNSFIIIGDVEAEKITLSKRKNYLESFSRVSRSNSLGAEEINGFLNYAEENKASVIDVHINVIVWDKSEKALAIKRQSTNTMFSTSLHCENLKVEFYNKLNLFIASLPGNEINIFKEYRFKTLDIIGAMLNNFTSLLQNTSQSGNFRVIDRVSQSPMQIDLSKGFNRNKFIIGGSGAGKSFNVNAFLDMRYQAGAHILIIDKGRSYEGIASAYNAKWYEYTEQNPLSFNPFILSKYDWDENTRMLSENKLQALCGIIKVLWRGEKGQFSQLENNIIKEFITEYYKDSTVPIRKFDTFFEFACNYQFAEKIEFDRVEFHFNLKSYYKDGSNSSLLNANETESMLNERLVVFELDSLKNNEMLLSIVTTVIMDIFSSKMQNISGEKIIAFDEAWAALSNEDMRENMRWLAKTARKHDAEIIVITQELDDILDSQIGSALINNCYTKILLDLSSFKNNFDKIQKFIGLTDFQKAQVLSINKGKRAGDKSRDFFVGFQNGKSYVVQLSGSRAQELLYSSDQDDKLAIHYVSDKLGITFAESVKYIVENLIGDTDYIMKERPKCKLFEAIKIIFSQKGLS